ncbi:hypothetical protein K505DRAFT_360842 [Melanomma pulvis-pyrius CBS 109.77]|uniref:Uncharacterized protein n=1 Tax=Melanomma pulvis-pyrius CBS 109.77 TaxID=1314802 RepID=A0A6A6XEK3_9PLEO|nr:hypothetical protein K505DRAFT_360842 [Melanomma pulvis-pyrius CBS 109.77]
MSFFVVQEERQRMFDHTSLLMFNAFPARVAARFLHSQWPECEMYIQHVHALVKCWRSYGELPKLKPPIKLCKLLADAGWLIHELGTYNVLERFLDSTFKIFEEGEVINESPMLVAKLHMISGVMFDNWGNFDNSINQFMTCLKIAQKYLNENNEFLGGIYNNLGNVSESVDKPN